MANNLTRFNPFNEMVRFEPFRQFEDMFRDFRLSPEARGVHEQQLIKMDVTESEQAYTVKAEIPGVRKEDIKIDIDKNQVSINAETKKESEEKEGNSIVRSERYYGQQYRSFTLGQNIDDEKATAKYADGVLELFLPKKGNGSAKKISVN